MNSVKRIFSVFTSFVLLFNSLATPTLAIAQELTPEPTATPEETSQPTTEPTQSPEASEAPTSTPEETALPTPSEEPTPTPTTEPTATPSDSNENSQPQAPPADNGNNSNNEASPTPSVSPSPSPEAEITEPALETEESTLLNQILTTGKLDYFPDEEVDIYGKGLLPITAYILEISSENEPPVIFSTPIITDSEGNFTYLYQLDEIYRPDYKVELSLNGALVASINFTDSDNDDEDDKVTICHATGSNSNPYEKKEVDDSAVNGIGTNANDHNRDGHQNGEDIIPPGPWDLDGRNWDTEGRAIWNNDCEVEKGKISITKDTDPETNNIEFDFDGSLGEFDLEDDQTKVFTQLEEGTYTIYEEERSGWKLTEITCNQGADVEVNIEDGWVSIDLDEDEEVSCTFNNVRAGSISGIKYNDENGNGHRNHGWTWINWHWVWLSEEKLEDWTIFIDANGNSVLDDGEVSTTTDEDGEYKFENLLAGTYRICEVQQPGWVNTEPGNICQTVHLSEGENEDDTDFGNKEVVETTIKVIKEVVDPNGDPVTDTSTGFVFNMTGEDPFTLYDEDGGETFTVQPGTYTITETPNGDYIFSGCTADYEGESEGQDVEYGETVRVYEGDNVVVTCVNAQDPVTINGTKWNDLNGNSERDYYEDESQEPGIQGWTIELSIWNGEGWDFVTSTTTDEDGNYSFGGELDLKPNRYLVCEVQQAGWDQTYPGENSCHDITLGSNEVSNGNDFGNFHRDPEIQILKSNNKSIVGQNDTVTYTLIVTNTGNMGLSSLVVIDALPGGFNYVPGSSLVDGMPYVPGIADGVLTWNLGYLGTESFVKIEYQVTTPSDLAPGVYTNLATCHAYIGRQISDFTDQLFSPFVNNEQGGVECDPTSSTVTMNGSNSYGGNLTGQVLGASTELPATGSETNILVLALALAAGGFGLKLIARGKKYAKN